MIIDTARTVCGAVSMKLSGVCLSVCLSVRPSNYTAAAASLLLWARRAGDIDRLLHSRRSNASSVTLSADVGS